MTDQADENPLESLIELFVYAPIGMLYEYPEVLPKLIKKGRSQVQLAKFFGQMAAQQRGTSISEPAMRSAEAAGSAGAQAADVLAKAAARFVTELGAQVGLAPPSGASAGHPAPTEPAPEAEPGYQATETGRTDSAPAADSAPTKTARLPIARYDDLTAKEVIGLLEDLTHGQLTRVRDHEAANRRRKTVLAKIDRLLP